LIAYKERQRILKKAFAGSTKESRSGSDFNPFMAALNEAKED